MEQDVTAYPEYRQLLAAVLAVPEDDTPRLVLADWLQEHSCEARAEFIRVQVRHAKLRQLAKTMRCESVSAVWCPECGLCTCSAREERMDAADCPLHAPDSVHAQYVPLHAREREERLFYAHADQWFPVPPGYGLDWGIHLAPAHGGPPTDSVGRPGWYEVSRGFIEHVTCPAADWLAHADAILVQHPITKVTLTTWPGVTCNESLGSWRLYDGVSHDTARPHRRVPGMPPNSVGGREAVRRLLPLEWPGIAFTLPA